MRTRRRVDRGAAGGLHPHRRPLEDVAAQLGDTPGFFQLYTPKDRDLAASLVARAEAAGYRGIIVTLDTWVPGWRPRDLATANFPQLRGHCLANYTSDPVFRAGLPQPPEENPQAAVLAWVETFGNPLTWQDLPWLRSLTDLPLIVKGICHPDDARRARDGGVDGIYCSNHGGRQANGGLAALDCLPAVVDAADGLPVLFDSGVRTGADIVKALALGASAVGIGRPYAYGLALGGDAGVTHVLRSLLAEADLIMAVDGYRTRAELTPRRCSAPADTARRRLYADDLTRSAHFSAIINTGAWMLLLGTVGMTEASAIRSPSTPRTRRSASTTASGSLDGPIFAVPHG